MGLRNCKKMGTLYKDDLYYKRGGELYAIRIGNKYWLVNDCKWKFEIEGLTLRDKNAKYMKRLRMGR